MPVVEAHFFAPEDLNGSTIFECSSDDQFLKGIRLDIQRDKLGNGLIEFARRVPLGIFVNDIVQPEVFVRFLVPEISATDYLWGCFLDYRQQKVVSVKEKGGEGFRFGGPGPKFYLTRTVLWSASFAGYDNAVHREEHVWTWPESARAGAILNRLILEDQSNPSGPFLPDLTKSFSDANDSAGVPWAEDVAAGADEFSLNIGDDYLKLLWTLENAGSLVTQMTLGEVGSPLMQLDAYQTFGRDLTGAIAADTVHFTEGVNILTDLDVEGASLRKASHALVRGAEGVYELAVRPSWDSSQYRKAAFHVYENTDNNTWLDKAGVRFLQRQENGERQIKLRWQPGFDPEAGLYMPGPDGSNGHVWVGDTVDLTTGGSAQTELDYDADPQLVTGIQMELLQAARDDSAEEAARSWKLTALLNYDRQSNATVPAGGTTGGGTDTHRPGPALCGRYLPATPGDQPVITDTADGQDDDGDMDIAVSVGAGDDRALYVLVMLDATPTVTWYPGYVNAGTPGSGTSLTLIDSRVITGSHTIFVFRLLNPATSTLGTSAVRISKGAGVRAIAGVWSLIGVDQSTPETAIGKSAGTGATSSVTVASVDGDLIIDVAGWAETNATVTTPTEAGDQTSRFARTIDRTFGLPDYAMGGSDGSDSTPAWGFTNSHPWGAVAVAVKTSGVNSTPDQHVLNGNDGCVARGDHQHHWYSVDEPTVDDDESLGFRVGTRWAQLDDLDTPTEVVAVWMLVDATDGAAVWAEWPGGAGTAADVSIADAGGYFTGTDVEAALQELAVGLGAGGSPAGMWTMSKTTSQTLTSGATDDITFDRADIDSGGSVIDLANDRFVIPHAGRYLLFPHWHWESTVPSAGIASVKKNGTQVGTFSRQAATAISNGTLGQAVALTCAAGDLIKMAVTPGSVAGVTARGNALTTLSSSFTLVDLASMGTWTSYTPAWTAGTSNPAIGNGSISGRYKLLDSKTVAIEIQLTMGSTTTYGSGHWFLGLPSGMTSGSLRQVVPCWYVDQGSRHYVAAAYIPGGGVRFELVHTEAGSSGTVTSTAPFTWANTDYVTLTGIIELA